MKLTHTETSSVTLHGHGDPINCFVSGPALDNGTFSSWALMVGPVSDGILILGTGRLGWKSQPFAYRNHSGPNFQLQLTDSSTLFKTSNMRLKLGKCFCYPQLNYSIRPFLAIDGERKKFRVFLKLSKQNKVMQSLIRHHGSKKITVLRVFKFNNNTCFRRKNCWKME